MPVTTETGFERPTYQELVARTQADYDARLAAVQSQFSAAALYALRLFVPVLAAVTAGAVYLLYVFLADYLARQQFVTTASDDSLDRHADVWGISRTPATYGEGPLRITGTDGTAIAAGLLWQTTDGVQFAVVEACAIVGTMYDATVRAVVAGSDGNVAAGQFLTAVTPVAGLDTTATVTGSGITGGADDESNDDLRERIRQRIAAPPQGGALSDYEAWALAVAGIGAVWVYGPDDAAGDGPGIVGVWIALDDEADPLPTFGAGHDCALAAVDAGGASVSILKTELAAALGYTPTEGDGVGATVRFSPASGASPQSATIDEDGLVTDGTAWLLTFSAALTTPPDDSHSVAVLGSEAEAVQAAIESVRPATAQVRVHVPVEHAYTLTIALTPDTGDIRTAAEAAVRAMEADHRAPGARLYNAYFHQALALVDDLERYVLSDVDGNGATGDVVPAANALPLLDTITWS